MKIPKISPPMEMRLLLESAELAYFALLVLIITAEIKADFDVCNPGTSNNVYQFSHEDCPSGVLFDHPIVVNCLGSTNYPEHFLTDLCTNGSKTLKLTDRPFQIHLAFQMASERVDADNSCYGIAADKCDAETIIKATNETLTPPDSRNYCDSGYEDGNLTTRRKDQYVFNQTERLFKYMLGLIDGGHKEGHRDLRLIRLIKHCFRIFKNFSDKKFIPSEFGTDVQKAFLFLFYQSDLINFKDISVDDYQILERTLTQCENMAPPFTLIGRSCKTCANIYGIEKMGKTLRYKENEFSFVWGKYDVPTDAAWNVVTFVHGLCYGTYKLHVNYHHLYEQEMERLFTPELQYRWNKPQKLYYEMLWDHIFSSSVKNAMRNLDVCIFGAYLDSPFLHRLERPSNYGDAKQTGNSGKRKRRSILPIMSLDDGGLKGAGWCFQTEHELVDTVSAYIRYQCPGVPVPPEILGGKDVNNNNSTHKINTTHLVDIESDSLETAALIAP